MHKTDREIDRLEALIAAYPSPELCDEDSELYDLNIQLIDAYPVKLEHRDGKLPTKPAARRKRRR